MPIVLPPFYPWTSQGGIKSSPDGHLSGPLMCTKTAWEGGDAGEVGSSGGEA